MDIDEILLKFLEEDIGREDITSNILPDKVIDAYIICKEHATIAGLEEASRLFRLKGCIAKEHVKDGMSVNSDTRILDVRGYAKAILSSERVALNILMRMSGIATLTKRFIDIAKSINPKVAIAGTRKTIPCFRYFDKKAITLAGGYAHRYRLDEMVLIKDNHLAIIGSIKEAVRLAKRYSKPIEVEVQSLDEAIEAIEAGADIIMLDNLSADEVKDIVKALKIRGLRDKVRIEVSGGINLNNIKDYAEQDVDIISIGALTHSARSIDMSLEVKL